MHSGFLYFRKIRETLHKAVILPRNPLPYGSMPAGFLCNLPKNLTTHLTHKLYAVFP